MDVAWFVGWDWNTFGVYIEYSDLSSEKLKVHMFTIFVGFFMFGFSTLVELDD